MKNAFTIIGLAALVSLSAAAAVEDYSITNLKLSSRQPWEEVIDITFTVNPPAEGTTAKAVELDIVASNGVDEVYISDAAISGRMASTGGPQRLFWRPDVDHPGRAYGDLRVYVSVKAEVMTHPPYMVVSLNDGTITYAGLSVTNAIKKYFFFRDAMPFRYIPPTTSDEWKAISGGDDFFWFGTDEKDAAYQFKTDADIAREDRRHKVTLTKGFYLAVYPATCGQLGILGVPGFDRTTTSEVAARGLSYEAIRGADTVGGYNFPTSGDVAPDSIVGKLRAMTGRAFDLPTNFQWEYAVRAGTTNTYLFTSSGSPTDGWLYQNFASIYHSTKPCNDWGLYGLIGCCHQWTTTLGRTSASTAGNDNYYLLTEDVTDPQGPAATYDHPYRITRGSHAFAGDVQRRVYRIAYKYPLHTKTPAELEHCGMRLCLPLDD